MIMFSHAHQECYFRVLVALCLFWSFCSNKILITLSNIFILQKFQYIKEIITCSLKNCSVFQSCFCAKLFFIILGCIPVINVNYLI